MKNYLFIHSSIYHTQYFSHSYQYTYFISLTKAISLHCLCFNTPMNFLSFRDQIYDWTLQTDENLFNEVDKLTQYVFETQKTIESCIQQTKSNLIESSSILSNNFNHYLRLSENKFTQNKIAEPTNIRNQDQQEEQVQPSSPTTQTKLQMFREALNISLVNLDIKQQQLGGDKDNVSISQLSLSQAIFKNARLPPYFGSKQFKAQTFLNLFYDQDLIETVYDKKIEQNLSNQPLSMPSQDIGSNQLLPNSMPNLPPPPSYSSIPNLAPPPSLSSLNLNSSSNFIPGNLPLPPLLNLPPPPPISNLLGSLPPPPIPTMSNNNTRQLSNSQPLSLPSNSGVPAYIPPSQQVQIDQDDPNKDLLDSILAATTRPMMMPQQQQERQDNYYNQQSTQQQQYNGGFNNNNNQQQQQSYQTEAPISQPPRVNRPMNFQEELALKLKYGKDYKKYIPKDDDFQAPPQQPQMVLPPPPSQEVQHHQQPAHNQQLIRGNTFNRQSLNIDELLKGNSNTTQNQTSNNNNKKPDMFRQEEEQQEQEQNSLFAAKTRRNTTMTNLNKFASTNTLSQQQKNKQADMLMSRNTFNDDMLFKKKPAFGADKLGLKANDDKKQDNEKQQQIKPKNQQKSKSPLPLATSKTVAKKKTGASLFANDDSDQQEQFTFKKRTTKANIAKKDQSNVKTKRQVSTPVLNTKSFTQAKTSKPQKNQKKNKLLFGGDSDQEEQDIFSKKKIQKKTSKQQKQKDDPFKKKPEQIQQVLAEPTKAIVKKTAQSPKKATNSLFANDQDDDQQFSFKPKSKTKSKQVVAEESPKKQTSISTKSEPKVQIKVIKQQKVQQQPRKLNPLFGTITQQEDQDRQSSRPVSKTQSDDVQQEVQQIQIVQEKSQEQLQKERKLKKIQAMGGMGMGMGPMGGMGMMLPKGMKITKPSETKQQEEIALRKQSEEEHHHHQINKESHKKATLQKEQEQQFKPQPKSKESKKFDPLQRIIKQTIINQRKQEKQEKTQQQQQTFKPKPRKLDPLQNLISQVITKPKKSQQEPISAPTDANQANNTGNALSTRRKKKPRTKVSEQIFDAVEEQAPKTVVVHEVEEMGNKRKQNQNYKTDSKSSLDANSEDAAKQQKINKISQMSGMGGMGMPGMVRMPGMGPMGGMPIMPKGLIITKPSQAKRLQKQALQKMQQSQKQQQAKKQKQKQQQLQWEQQRQKQRQISEQNQKNRQQSEQQQEKIERQKYEAAKKQRIRVQRQREQQQQRVQEQKAKKQLKYKQQQQQQQQKLDQARRQKQKEEKQQADRRQRQQENQRQAQRNKLPSLSLKDDGKLSKKVNPLMKGNSSNPLGVPKMPTKSSGNNPLLKSPLDSNRPVSKGKNPLLSGPIAMPISMPTKSPLGMPTIKTNQHSIPSTGSKKPGKSIFGDQYDDTQPKAKITETQPVIKTQPKVSAPSKGGKKSLFDESDQEDSGFGKKSKTNIKTQQKPKATLLDSPSISKPAQKKKPSLFGNDEQQDLGFGRKKKVQKIQEQKPFIPQKQTPTVVPQKSPIKTSAQPKKKTLFGGSDSDEDTGFGSKKKTTKTLVNDNTAKIESVQPISQHSVPSPIKREVQQPKIQPKKRPAKKGLFGESDSDDENTFKKPKKNIIEQSKPVPAVVNTPVESFKENPKPKKAKKGLFSQSQEDQPVISKAKNKPVIPVVTPVNNRPTIQQQQAPKIQQEKPKTVNLPASSSKFNPLGASGSSSNNAIKKSPLQSPAKNNNPLSKPIKKRNIFSGSSEDEKQSAKKNQNFIGQNQKIQAQQPAFRVQQDNYEPEPQVKEQVTTNNNRRLFDNSDSDSDEDQAMKKKQRAATRKLKGLF